MNVGIWVRAVAAGVIGLASMPASASSIVIPPDTVACDIWGWSNDKDPKGLNVRAAPDPKGAIVGQFVERKGADGSQVEFHITGMKDGWFLVDDASYGDYGEPAPATPPYAGKGWVSGSLVGGQITGETGGAFYAAPDDKARQTKFGVDTDSVQVKKLIACKGTWVQVETTVGSGWVKGLCSNQVTTCP